MASKRAREEERMALDSLSKGVREERVTSLGLNAKRTKWTPDRHRVHENATETE